MCDAAAHQLGAETIMAFDLGESIQLLGSVSQVCTALIAVGIATLTFRHQKRQGALTLINQTNAMANLVNSTVIQSPEARAALGRLQDPIVGCADDAVLFLYLNYVHNTYRTFVAGAIRRRVWSDTLDSCAAMLGRLRRDQVERLLSRGYETAFRHEVLGRYDRAQAAVPAVGERPRLSLAA